MENSSLGYDIAIGVGVIILIVIIVYGSKSKK